MTQEPPDLRLDEDSGDWQTEIDGAWPKEMARRYADLKSGRDPGVSAEQSLADMRRAIQDERTRHP